MEDFVGFVVAVLAMALIVVIPGMLLAPHALESVMAGRTPAFLALLAGAEIARRRSQRAR